MAATFARKWDVCLLCRNGNFWSISNDWVRISVEYAGLYIDVVRHLVNAKNILQQSLLFVDFVKCHYGHSTCTQIFVSRCQIKSKYQKHFNATMVFVGVYLTNVYSLHLRFYCQNISRLVRYLCDGITDERQSTLCIGW